MKRNKKLNLLNETNNTNNTDLLDVDDSLDMLARSYSEIQEQMRQSYVSTFQSKLFSDGIISEVKATDVQNYLANPEEFHKEIEKLSTYYYISNGDIFQLFDLAKILPTLDYSVTTDDKSKSYEKNITACNKILNNQVKHKQLTRDIISQTITSGTLTGIWLGDKKKPYLYIFDDVEYAFPAYRKQGDWVVWVDLAWFDSMSPVEREQELSNLSPYVTLADYERYKQDSTKGQYIELPLERSVVLHTHTIKRNQRFGISWATQGLYDILHKKKLKDMETTVANKIINAVAVLTLGDEKNPNLGLNKELKRKVFGGVKTAMDKGNAQGVTCITLPEWGKLEFPDLKSDALNPDKFTTINQDIEQATGVGGAVKSGNGGNFASSNINFETLYKRIAVMLEDIETEVYGKLLKLILPSSVADSYRMVYDKQPPLTNKEKIDILSRLNDKGFSLRAVIESLGINFDSYIGDTLYEQDTLKLPDKIRPYQSSSTLSSKGRPSGSSNTENTGGNEVPEA